MRKVPSGAKAGVRPLLFGFALAVALTGVLFGMAVPAEAQAPQTRVFNSGSGLILFNIKPDKTQDFEMVMGRTKEALLKSAKPERKQQAASWKVFKAVEPGPAGAVTYIIILDPAVKEADYTVVNILNEAFPRRSGALQGLLRGVREWHGPHQPDADLGFFQAARGARVCVPTHTSVDAQGATLALFVLEPPD